MGETKNISDNLQTLRDQINKYFVGKPEIVEDVLCCFLAGGHVLLEDVPGVGKTTLARTFAGALGLSFGRIQFTPDTMPTDVTGLCVYNMKTGEFDFRPGAIMKNIVLADELNRTSPKTQSALLEAMAEAQVSVDGNIMPLPRPFMVIATQNPASYTGTYPLPEAQMDRFMMRLSIGYPDESEELRMVRSHMEGVDDRQAAPVLSESDAQELIKAVEDVRISDGILSYMQQIADATRRDGSFSLGVSPRGLIHLMQAARARAVLCGRDYCLPDDVKQLAVKVLAHRLVLTTEMKLMKKSAAELLYALVLGIKVPME
ncbi:MAG: MoxR family ATPase [Lachnospiraceae bacterium]|nr:MoxR family ATPase [Lachnospiraceae bacterium]